MSPNPLIQFEFEASAVRIVLIDGAPWFVAKDVATALGYKDPQGAVRKHCKRAAVVGVAKMATPHDLDPQTVIIPEADLYRLMIRSKLPSAQAFEAKVVEEILPQIRRTGSYQTDPFEEWYVTDRSPQQILQIALEVQRRSESLALEAQRERRRADQMEARLRQMQRPAFVDSIEVARNYLLAAQHRSRTAQPDESLKLLELARTEVEALVATANQNMKLIGGSNVRH